MVVPAPADAWLIIADHYQARLLGCSETPTGRCHITEYSTIESPISDIEYARPCALAGMTGYSYAANHKRLEEEYRRFARQLGRWINTCLSRFRIQELTAFVPVRSHQDVLAQVRHDDRNRVTLRGENLMRLSRDTLCRHRLVSELIHPHKAAQIA